MFVARYVTQPEGGINYLTLFQEALHHATFDRFDAAVAYATMRGVDAIVRPFLATDPALFEQLQKRWLIGIDWCRSEPLALERLSAAANSYLKVPDGLRTVGRRGCTPALPFHPKTFILQGPGTLPVPADGGPPKYDRERLLFEKHSDRTFLLRLGTAAQRRDWEKKSTQIDAIFHMTSGRAWGVF